jgi:hypothetical protein
MIKWGFSDHQSFFELDTTGGLPARRSWSPLGGYSRSLRGGEDPQLEAEFDLLSAFGPAKRPRKTGVGVVLLWPLFHEAAFDAVFGAREDRCDTEYRIHLACIDAT